MRAVEIRKEDRTERHEVHFGPAEKMFAVEPSEQLELAACCGTAAAAAAVPPVVVVALPVSEHPGQIDVANDAELGGRTLVPD